MRKAVLALLCSAAPVASLAAGAEPLTALNQAYEALQAGRYEDVENFYAVLREENTRTPTGSYVYEDFTHAVYWYSSSDPANASYWPKVDAATKAWLAHSPKSYVAGMTRAYALAYRAKVVAARERAWKDADRLAEEAATVMDASRAKGGKDPLWHAVRLRVASAQGLPRTDVVSMIHEALRVDATVMMVWREASIALAPDGRGYEDLPWLMRLAVQRTAGTEGTSMYARVLHAVYWRFHEFRDSPFIRGGIDWNVLHASFLDWEKRYPAGYEPELDLHAAMACSAGDAVTTASLLAKPGMPRRPNTWKLMGGGNYFTLCKDWATAVPQGPKT